MISLYSNQFSITTIQLVMSFPPCFRNEWPCLDKQAYLLQEATVMNKKCVKSGVCVCGIYTTLYSTLLHCYLWLPSLLYLNLSESILHGTKNDTFIIQK